MAKNIPNATFLGIDSHYGHDGFLTETAALSQIFEAFLVEKSMASAA